MERSFAIGDIHGCSKTFKKLLLDKLKIRKTDTIYCIGDYIDRGNDSKGVIDFILTLRGEGYQIETLRGNHEQMLLNSFSNGSDLDLWLQNGGTATLCSFGIKALSELPPAYLSFFLETKYYIRIKNYILVHAGLNFEEENIFEDKDAMLWIRGFNPVQPVLKDQLLIHGHTPKPLGYILGQKGNCINIDSGCVYKDRNSLGNLMAFYLEEKKFIFEKNVE